MEDEAAAELPGDRGAELTYPYLDRDVEVGALAAENQVPYRAANKERASTEAVRDLAQEFKQFAVGKSKR